MSMRDNLGRHWRVKGSTLQAFTRNPKTKKDSVEIELDLAKPKQAQTHKCGGTMLKVVGVPKLFGEWLVCSKCSAQKMIERDELWSR